MGMGIGAHIQLDTQRSGTEKERDLRVLLLVQL